MDEDLVPALSEQEEREAREKEERVKKLAPLAKDVVLVLVKTIKATSMYLPNNPIYQKFREELKEKFAAYFEHEDLLSFHVKRFELTFLDQQVYQNPDKEDNIALMFFKDGVREFCFQKGMTDQDTDGFIDILKSDVKERELDDDLVTLMWEKDFQNITYTVTDEATDEEAAEEDTILSFEEEPEAIRQLEELRQKAAEDAARAGQAGTGAEGAAAGAGSGASVSATEAALASFAQGPDTDPPRGSFQPPGDLALLTELTGIFYEILLTEKDSEKFEMVAGSLSKALDIFVGKGDLALATILVIKVRELAGAEGLPAESMAGLDGIIEKACSEGLVAKVGEFMEQGGQESSDAGCAYLKQLDDRAMGPMVKLLEALSARKARRAVCDIMAGICAGKGRKLVPYLAHRYWFVTRNVAMVMGKVADPDTVSSLAALLKNGDGRVRKEALGALAAIKGDRAVDALAAGLDDPDRQNRVLSARFLSELSPERAYSVLKGRVADKAFEDKEFDEQRDLFEILGRSGGAGSLPFLSEIFNRKGIFKSAKRDRLRACAAYGLAATGETVAKDLLKGEVGSKSKTVRAACLDGLKRMGV